MRKSVWNTVESSIFRYVHVCWLNPEPSLPFQIFLNSSASTHYLNPELSLPSQIFLDLSAPTPSQNKFHRKIPVLESLFNKVAGPQVAASGLLKTSNNTVSKTALVFGHLVSETCADEMTTKLNVRKCLRYVIPHKCPKARIKIFFT